MFRRLLFLIAAMAVAASACIPRGTVHKVAEYPGLESAQSIGYLEIWAPTSFGMWMKDLEEGPSTCDTFRVWKSGMDEGDYLGITKVLEWPGTLGSLKYRPIADNFSVTRFAMPAGKHELFISAGLICYSHDEEEKFLTGGYAVPGASGKVYSLPVFPMEVEVEPDAIRLYKVGLQRDEGKFIIRQQWTDTLLPVPENPKKMDPDPQSYLALVRMLEDEGWGFRWYAAKRIRYVGNKSTIPIIEERLRAETHKDVRNELEKALEKLSD
jgi:hypothetical protein